MKTLRLYPKPKRSWGPRVPRIARTEVQENLPEPTRKEMEHWLLWTGISPKAGMPVSQIGIYTDFT